MVKTGDAYDDGREAYFDGYARDENPYEDDPDRGDWAHGWDEAEEADNDE